MELTIPLEAANTFTTTNASLTIPANALTTDIIITPIVDATFELNEMVILTIQPTLGNSRLGSNFSATGTILNDDPAI